MEKVKWFAVCRPFSPSDDDKIYIRPKLIPGTYGITCFTYESTFDLSAL